MKRAILAVFLGVIMSLSSVFAASDIKVYGNIAGSSGDAVVGERGYMYTDSWNLGEVYVCAKKDGTVKRYGMNLKNDASRQKAEDLVKTLSMQSFTKFDHFGCLRARI